MKKRILKIGAALACLALLLGAAGGKLARPERETREEDRFVGFQMVFERLPGEGERVPVDETGWVEYGSDPVRVAGMGTLDLPRRILIGRYSEETGEYSFPGREGRNCFLAVRELEEGGTHYTGHQGLAGSHISIRDDGESLSGTLYFGPPLDDSAWGTNDYEYGWTAYRVYQMEDGTVYLDGSGNSYGGVGGFTTTTREERTQTINGESVTQSFEVSVAMEAVERLTAVQVKWYGGDGALLAGQAVEPEGELSLTPVPGAAWALVEETDRLGAVTRTAYTLGGEQGASHRLVLLDERGMGRVETLILEAGKAG